jgi:4'-phosphopantetheinyl transferase
MSTAWIPGFEVHLWRASLDIDERTLARLRSFLNPAELARADRLRVVRAVRRFVAARATLRLVLAGHTGVRPSMIEFEHGPNGKPRIARGGPHFNASDSGDTVVVAVASDEIGVDIEVSRALRDRDRLARRICTQDELLQLSDLPESERTDALLALWTFKEAALKAIGTGLPGGLKNVEVDFGSPRSPRLVRLLGSGDQWSLMTTDFGIDGLLCSVVVRGRPRQLVGREIVLETADTSGEQGDLDATR